MIYNQCKTAPPGAPAAAARRRSLPEASVRRATAASGSTV